MTGYSHIFVDTSPFIYFLEGNDVYSPFMETFFMECRQRGVSLVTSVITAEEYLVHPIAQGDDKMADNFKEFLSFMEIDLVCIDMNIAEKAALIRAQCNAFKAMDALQIATALECGCDAFLTNDKQLRQEKYLPCIILDDIQKAISDK